ncbi:Uncharacterised protein [Klebsiella pneumoniae]|uniref:Uncharacterized protein n=1 Tax=Klebsiella pneumoniae TaxID=573 RepID=A0A2X3FAJ1_KLEPN|nr:Uncharacterised protein [Klebsiella pneumoniae]
MNANPPVKDRINSMNAMFCNGNGDRRYKVNVAPLPGPTVDCLEQQVWIKTGEPDKKSDNDHPQRWRRLLHCEAIPNRSTCILYFTGHDILMANNDITYVPP